jgi:hypothetical protein
MSAIDSEIICTALYNAMDYYVRCTKFVEKEPESLELRRELRTAQARMNKEFDNLREYLTLCTHQKG